MAISEQQATSPYAGRRMTLDEFLALPEQEPSLEYEDGLVTQKVSPHADHSSIASIFYDELNRIGRGRRIGRAFPEMRFKVENWSPVPDVSFYLKERLRPQSSRRYGDFADVPDIAVEVVSPGQNVSEQIRKCLRYVVAGVRISLLADQDDETVFLFRPGEPTRALRDDDRINLDDVLPGFELTVRRLFDSVVTDWDEPSSEHATCRRLAE